MEISITYLPKFMTRVQSKAYRGEIRAFQSSLSPNLESDSFTCLQKHDSGQSV